MNIYSKCQYTQRHAMPWHPRLGWVEPCTLNLCCACIMYFPCLYYVLSMYTAVMWPVLLLYLTPSLVSLWPCPVFVCVLCRSTAALRYPPPPPTSPLFLLSKLAKHLSSPVSCVSVCGSGPLLHCAVHEAQRLRARMGGDVRAGVRCTEHDAAGVLAVCCNAVQYNTVQCST
jgi:hypothetical protein